MALSNVLRGALALNAALDAYLALGLRGSAANMGNAFPGLSADGHKALGASMLVHALIRGYAAKNFESRDARRAAQLSYIAEIGLAVLLRREWDSKRGLAVVLGPALLILGLEYLNRRLKFGSHDSRAVTSAAELLQLYGTPSRIAVAKVAKKLDKKSMAFISRSPFFCLATVGPTGVHCTPRGDPLGAVQALDDYTLAFGDRKGNNRLDGMKDILADGTCALLFLIPGTTETLRVNGRAFVTTDPALRKRFICENKEPTTVVIVRVEEVFMQCAKALMRSKIWGMKRPEGVPTMGELIEVHSGGIEKAEDVDSRLTEEAYRAVMY